MPNFTKQWSKSNDSWRHSFSAARLISDSLFLSYMTLSLVLFFFLSSAFLKFFWLQGTIIIFVYSNKNNNIGD